MINLRKNEKIYAIKRRHLIVLIVGIFPFALFLLIGAALMIYLFFVPFSVPESALDIFPFLIDVNAKLLALYIVSTFMLVLWQISFLVFTNYYLDTWIITNQRTIHTELKSIFSRYLSTVPHANIQDITVDVTGILPTIFKYGDLQIQTAGKFQEFIFKQIPEPYKAKELVFKAQKQYFKDKEDGLFVDDNPIKEINY